MIIRKFLYHLISFTLIYFTVSIGHADVRNGVSSPKQNVPDPHLLPLVQTLTFSTQTGFVNLKDLGIKCDGKSDDTLVINNALQAANHTTVIFPSGICLYRGGGVLKDGVTVYGMGKNATKIVLTTPNAIGFTVSGYGASIRSIGFDARVPQTGGSYVVLSGIESSLEDFFMTGDYNGVLMTGNVARIRHGRFQDGAKDAIRIRAEGGDNSQMIDDVLMGAQSPQVSKAGIRVRNSSALIIRDTSVIQQGTGLLVDPYMDERGMATDAGSVYSLIVHDSFFDNSSGDGIKIVPTGNANVLRSRFSNLWISSSGQNGFLVSNQGRGLVSGIQILGSHAVLNQKAGIALQGNLQDISIDNGLIGENDIGVLAKGKIEGLRITNSTIGNSAGVKANRQQGVLVDNASHRTVIANNDISGNGKPSNLPTHNLAKINNNIGISDR